MWKKIRGFSDDIKKRFWIYLISILVLSVGLWLAGVADDFVERFTYECPLNDTIHNLLPLVNVNIIVSLFPTLFSILVYGYVIINKKEREKLPYILFVIGIFNMVRALFLVLTQLPPPYPRIDDYPYMSIPGWYFGTRDLFPSGHVAFPFFMFLFLDKGFFKWFSLFSTLLLALGVLLMRVHYSIDVLGSIFIVYALYCFCEKYIRKFFFNKEN